MGSDTLDGANRNPRDTVHNIHPGLFDVAPWALLRPWAWCADGEVGGGLQVGRARRRMIWSRARLYADLVGIARSITSPFDT